MIQEESLHAQLAAGLTYNELLLIECCTFLIELQNGVGFQIENFFDVISELCYL